MGTMGQAVVRHKFESGGVVVECGWGWYILDFNKVVYTRKTNNSRWHQNKLAKAPPSGSRPASLYQQHDYHF